MHIYSPYASIEISKYLNKVKVEKGNDINDIKTTNINIKNIKEIYSNNSNINENTESFFEYNSFLNVKQNMDSIEFNLNNNISYFPSLFLLNK